MTEEKNKKTDGLSLFKAHSPRQGAGREWETHEGGVEIGQNTWGGVTRHNKHDNMKQKTCIQHGHYIHRKVNTVLCIFCRLHEIQKRVNEHNSWYSVPRKW